MSKKVFLIILIAAVFFGVVGFFILLNQNQIPRIDFEESPSEGFQSFPDARIPSEEGFVPTDGGLDNQGGAAPSRVSVQNTSVNDSRFFQVVDAPVAGFTSLIREEVVIDPPPVALVDSMVEYYNFFEFGTLRIGDTGEGVEALQIILNRLNPEQLLEVGGEFNTDTKNRVISFQTNNNLTPDGIVGRGTQTKLNEVQNIPTDPEEFEPVERIVEHPVIRFQSRANGIISDYNLNTQEVEQITDLVFAGVYESFFANGGNSFVSRYLSGESIQTYVGSILSNEEGFFFVEGEFFASNIPFVSISRDGLSFLYFEVLNRKSIGQVFDFVSGQSRQVFNSSFTEWLPQFNGTSLFTLTTRAASDILGYSYVYDANNVNSFEKGVGGLPGLTTNYNENATKVLYSINNGRFIETYVRDMREGTTTRLGIATLAEKCVWKDLDVVLCAVPRTVLPAQYPEDWYQGSMLFNDRIWEVNTQTGIERILSSLLNENLSGSMDAFNLVLQNNILMFMNKHDLSLWALDLR